MALRRDKNADNLEAFSVALVTANRPQVANAAFDRSVALRSQCQASGLQEMFGLRLKTESLALELRRPAKS